MTIEAIESIMEWAQAIRWPVVAGGVVLVMIMITLVVQSGSSRPRS